MCVREGVLGYTGALCVSLCCVCSACVCVWVMGVSVCGVECCVGTCEGVMGSLSHRFLASLKAA